ncbi:M20 metallopeptidase family protein [Rhizobium sp. 21-4511-3d]
MPRPDQLAAELVARMIAVRRHLHVNPELSNEEAETQAYLRAQLEAEGLADIRDVAGCGLSVDIAGTGGFSNRKVAVRADIDALPIEERSGVAFSSAKPGVMHACGHDAHAAMVFAAATHLHRHRDSFAGTVRFIFQPAEEAEPLGGRRVVEEGLLDDIDAAIGIHVDPYTETGKISVSGGPYTLASDIFDVIVRGTSAHAAKPAEGVDAIAAACAMVSELQKIVARETDAYDPLVVSITGIEGGGAYNVIADTVRLKGTIRSGSPATRLRARERVHEILEGLGAAHRATVEFKLIEGEPPVVNDAALAQLVSSAADQLFGAGTSIAAPGWTAADDFGFYSEKRPSVYFRLGIRNEAEGSIFPLHHPQFRVDEAALKIGAETIAKVACEALGV